MAHDIRESTDASPHDTSTPFWPLDPGQVHVWQASFDDAAARAGRLAALLSDDEAARRERLRFERDKQRFAIGRGLLRALLGRYTGLDPRGLRFRYGAHGKPALAATPGDQAIRFNVAHAGDIILYVLAGDREVGVDVEQCRPMPDAESIVDRFFSPRERRAFHALPAHERSDAFFRGWTRKEAYVKARGGGLSLPFDQFDVSLAAERALLLETRGAAHDEQAWTLLHLAPAPGYVGAVAAPGRDWSMSLRHWDWDRPAAGNDI